jgi:Domain of unknown function (DUF4276)
MHIEFLVEDLSTQVALDQLLPKMLPIGTEYNIRAFRGKEDLLKKLPDRLAGYKSWITDDWRIVVLLDRDNQNCIDLKTKLDTISLNAGLLTKTAQQPGQLFQVLNRIMVEELEAWFFGDFTAICSAYSGVKASLAQNSKYRDPDAIKGGTWEALDRVLHSAGHIQTRLDKLQAAREIAAHMDPDRNRSASFWVFYQGLRSMTAID